MVEITATSMRILDKLLNRRPSYSQMSFVVGSEPPKNPQDKLGDPLAALSSDLIERDYRTKINRGELALPMWALHEALRLCPQLGNYQRLWIDSLTGMDWSIKEVADPAKSDEDQATTIHEQRAQRQAAVLRSAYEAIDVVEAVRHLALANLYGYSFLVRKGRKLEPLNWWNFARIGLYGAWKWNPHIRVQDGRNLVDAEEVDMKDYVFREVEEGCLLEYLRLYLRFREIERYWDDNLEKESQRQVVIIPGQLNNGTEAEEFKVAARGIAAGGSGCLAAGNGDKTTQVLFPPESRGLPYYENRLKMLDELACKVLFGAPLIANAESGSGTLAGNAHSDTAEKRIQAAAMDISSSLQQHYDRRVLIDAGLLKDGETPLAYFELIDRKAVDPEKEIQWTGTLSAAGWDRDADELSERAGMKLVKAPKPQAPAPGGLWNREDLRNFDPGQLRYGDGQWVDTGGGSAPKRISSGEADAILEKGVTEKAVNGKQVHFGQRLKQKLESDPAYSGRKEVLGWGREAVRSGHHTQQVVKGEMRDYYAKVFQSEGKGVLVIVDAKDGEAFNLFQSDERYLGKKGYLPNRADEPRQSEQPPPGVLQDLAAAGILPDCFYDTTPQDLVNRASDELGVPAAWLQPVRELLAEIVEKAESGELDEDALARYIEQAARRVPELFGEMDLDAFARLLEGVMGTAAVEGVRDALRH